jgi:hypothetical protein
VLQHAHPLIAKGTAGHSGFTVRPLGRLHNALTDMYAVVFPHPLGGRCRYGLVRVPGNERCDGR